MIPAVRRILEFFLGKVAVYSLFCQAAVIIPRVSGPGSLWRRNYG